MTQVTLIKFCDTAPTTIAEPGTLKHLPVIAEKNPTGGWLIKLDNPELISNCIKNHEYFLVDPPEYTGARVPNNCSGVERKRFEYKALTPQEMAAGRKMAMIEIFTTRDAEKKAEKAAAVEVVEAEEIEPIEEEVAPEPAKKPTWSRKPKNKE
jgi:hypothetical protein